MRSLRWLTTLGDGGRAVTLVDDGQPTSVGLTAEVRSVLHRQPRPRQRPVDVWQRHYLRLVVLVDLVIILASTLLALHLRFGDDNSSVSGLSYAMLSIVLVPVWVGALMVARAYETRFIGTGADEFKRVSQASLRLMAVLALIAYIFKLDLARGYVVVALPVGDRAAADGPLRPAPLAARQASARPVHAPRDRRRQRRRHPRPREPAQPRPVRRLHPRRCLPPDPGRGLCPA